MAEPLGEGRFQTVIVAPSLHELAVDESPVRIRARGDDAERDVVAGPRIVGQVPVVVDFFAALTGEAEVGLDADAGADLGLNARRVLMPVGPVAVGRRILR